MTLRTIRPAEGRRVRHPVIGRLLLAEGETVEWSSYWERRAQDGDVEILDPPADPAPDAAPRGKAATPSQEG